MANPLEAPLGGVEEVAHLLRHFELQTDQHQAWAAREAIPKLEEVIELLRPVADAAESSG